MENPQVIKDYLEVERKRRVLLGPFERSEVSDVHISRFGVTISHEVPIDRWADDLSHVNATPLATSTRKVCGPSFALSYRSCGR